MSILLDIFNSFRSYMHLASKEEVLDAKAAAMQSRTGELLDWRKSLTDRMKVLSIADDDTTYSKRKQIAAYYGIEGYKGTEAQNAKLAEAITDDIVG